MGGGGEGVWDPKVCVCVWVGVSIGGKTGVVKGTAGPCPPLPQRRMRKGGGGAHLVHV